MSAFSISIQGPKKKKKKSIFADQFPKREGKRSIAMGNISDGHRPNYRKESSMLLNACTPEEDTVLTTNRIIHRPFRRSLVLSVSFSDCNPPTEKGNDFKLTA